MLMPMPGDIDTSTHPHLVMSRHMIEEKLQPAQPGRPAHDAAMQTNVEQLRAISALGVQHIECIFQIGEKLLAVVETLGSGEAHVVGIEGVGNHQGGALGPLTQ